MQCSRLDGYAATWLGANANENLHHNLGVYYFTSACLPAATVQERIEDYSRAEASAALNVGLGRITALHVSASAR